MMKRRVTAALVLAAMTTGALLTGCSVSDPARVELAAQVATVSPAETAAPKRGTAVGELAPDFALTRSDGTLVSLADLKGRPAVVVFWTAWCASCEEEAPHLNKLAAEYGPRGVRVIGINVQDSPARTEGGVKDFGIRYEVARDPDARVARSYNVVGTPTVLFLDAEGIVRYNSNKLPEDYPALLDALLDGEQARR